MLILTGPQIHAGVTMPDVIHCIRNAFRTECAVPPRQIVPVPGANGDRLLFMMPAFGLGGAGVVKLSTLFPDNPAKGRPTIQGAIVVFSDSGTPVAVLDGRAITHLRTAAASAVASSYLSRAESAVLLVVGTGDLAPSMAVAHCAVRPIRQVQVWGRRPEAAAATAAAIRSSLDAEIEVSTADSLASAVARADVISCATSSAYPVLLGKWLKPGTFVDLVGSFSPSRREADDEVILRSRVFVDTLEGALSEAGDLLDPLERKVISPEHIVGELRDLVNGRVHGRRNDSEITLFKSVGTAVEDLALARFVVDRGAGSSAVDP